MVTLKMIAEEVGVQESTVSRILNKKASSIKFSETTRKKVLETAHRLGYQPNAAARALATKRTGCLGFILSDTVQGGWKNMYYAEFLAGAERACLAHGYGLNICLYNISNLEDFVFPKSVRQRSVDGVILCATTDPAVVKLFSEAKIPAVQIGENISISGLSPSLASDNAGGLAQAIEYAASLGHKKILLCRNRLGQIQDKKPLIIKKIEKIFPLAGLDVKIYNPPSGHCNYNAAESLMSYYMSLSEAERPSLIISSDQTMAAMTRELQNAGINCPEDVSLISDCETALCSLVTPNLTSINFDLGAVGEGAVSILVDHLDNNKTLDPNMVKIYQPKGIIKRESCAVCKK